MSMNMSKTFLAKDSEMVRKWYLINAEDKVLGRLAVRIADILRGKRKPIFTPNVDCGDFVVVVNAEKVHLTGRKAEQKVYKRFSGYPGGQKTVSFEKMIEEHPDHILLHAVKGMLPSNPLGRAIFKKLKVYSGSEHPHAAQKLEKLEV